MGKDDFDVDLDDATDPLVLGLDVGSTATRGALYDALGRPVERRAKVPHTFTTGRDGTSQIDPDQVADEIGEVIDELTDNYKLHDRVRGVAMDTFASSLVGVDADGDAVTPCFTYADSRCREYVGTLRDRFDESEVQQRTGTRFHTSYQAPRLMWLRDTQPDLVAKVARWYSLGEYVQAKLLGTTAAGTPIAAWSGLLNRHTGEWDDELLDAVGIDAEQLSPVQDPGVPLDGVDTHRVKKRWKELKHADWFPVVADGIAANLGPGATGPATMAASCATSGAARVVLEHVPEHIPDGLWCYRIDAGRCLLGGALNDVGRLVSWLQRTLQIDDDPDDLDELLAADPTPGGPTVVPFLTGERSTGWAASAHAVFADVSGATTPESLFRAACEGIAVSYGRVADQLTDVADGVKRVVASGRVAKQMPHLLQLLADVLDRPVDHVDIHRTTLRGTALLALETVAPDVTRADVPVARTLKPRSEHREHYARVRERFESLYGAATGAH